MSNINSPKTVITSKFRPEDLEYMQQAVEEGSTGVRVGDGGPFGAVVVNSTTGQVIARNHNRVLSSNDPTAHAEISAIREACSKLGRFSLHDCVLYSSCEPCPMCLSAIIWAKIPKCYFAATADDAANVGFDDRFLYDFIRGKPTDEKCSFVHVPHSESDKPFQVYTKALSENKSGRY